MIALVGEQPIPVLLPILKEKKAGLLERIILVCSAATEPVGKRLQKNLGYSVPIELFCIEPYDILKAQGELSKIVLKLKNSRVQFTFNLTGGTKSMAFAAYSIAVQNLSPFLYLQSEGKKSRLHQYSFAEEGKMTHSSEEIPQLLDIDTYLKAYLNNYAEKPLNECFEVIVSETLRSKLDEIKTSVTFGEIGSGEVDLVLRYGNHVGIAEIKSGKKALSKEGIDQLNTAAEQRFLGTYTAKILIVDREFPKKNNSTLAKAHRIHIMELPSFSDSGGNDLSESDKEKLVSEVIKILGG